MEMRIGILGGTGNLGHGLAVRFCAAGFDVIIGSRDPARGAEVARRLGLVNARGAGNAGAAREADIAIITCPHEGHAAFVRVLAGKVVVDAVVPLGEGFAFLPPSAGSAAAETQALVPGAHVVAAFHTLS